MKESQSQMFAMRPEFVLFTASVRGAGAAAPTITPTTFSATSSIQYTAASNQFASLTAGDIVRSGAGVYTIKLRDSIPVVHDILCNVWGTDSKRAQITDYNPTTQVISVKTTTAAGVAADLATTDNLKLTIVGQLSQPNY